MKQIKQYLDELMEKSTPDKPVWNMEAILENKPAHWSYVDGAMGMAILNMYEATGEEKYIEFLDNFIDYYIEEDGSILGYELIVYNSDSINEGKLLFALLEKTGKEKYRLALDKLYTQVKWQPRTNEGSFWHKLVYPYQVWLDGLYMVEPFYVQYELTFNDGKNIKDIMAQFENVEKLMKDQETGLFYHGYDESRQLFWADKKTGLSKHFWTRSLGWYAMALVDTIALLPEKFAAEKNSLSKQLNDLLASLLKFQDADSKLFYQVTDLGGREGNYLETSGSCAISYTLMKAARLEIIASENFERGKEILEHVVSEKLSNDQDGFALNDICLVAGLGGMNGRGTVKVRDGSFEYYISEPKVQNDAKGVAPLIFAYSEVLKNKL
ncbi:glycoside hydrolase family 88/105 protein [Enterococcus timonensis]|uniref:glycoside hydrolase family 88/105 protein n=1 Tax=Enterococcus timonensis TaxID=1852364 RepID=UPI0008DACB15|nr:glycoside hydrolase family 88 protein [Enterococcus timonensis]